MHGTNDADTDDHGSRWWQQGSRFTTSLVEHLARHGFPDAEIRPVHWSGANSDFDRMAGAATLAAALKDLAASGRPHAVLAHSHGGNVTMEALARAPQSAALGSVVTFGTPFFERSLKLVPRIIALFQVVLGVVILPVMLWYLVAVFSAGTTKWVEAILVFGGLATVAAWCLYRGLTRLNYRRRSIRNLASRLEPSRWLVIHSPRDEAMRLLEAAGAISPRYVSTAGAMRSLKAFAALAGVVGTIAFLATTWRYFLDPITTKLAAGQYDLGTAADLTFLLLVPVIYGIVVLLVVGIARMGGAWAYARLLSGAIRGGVLGAAYGGDGHYKLMRVTRLPPYMPGASEARIDALALGGIDDLAVFNAAHKLYDSVVSDDGPEGGIGNPDIMWKRLSDALYHNAYMRDEGVTAAVAEYVASNWRASPQTSMNT